MGNFDWGINPNDNRPLNIVLFISRNKDNKHLKDLGYKERRKAFLTHEPRESKELKKQFEDFCAEGISGEMSRFYYSVNERDPHKTYKEFLHFLIDNPDFNLCSIQTKLAGIAAKKENRATSRWMFDFDSNDIKLVNKFLNKISKLIEEPIEVIVNKTPNGYAIVVPHRFDCRELLTDEWDFISLKRDDFLCCDWTTKE